MRRGGDAAEAGNQRDRAVRGLQIPHGGEPLEIHARNHAADALARGSDHGGDADSRGSGRSAAFAAALLGSPARNDLFGCVERGGTRFGVRSGDAERRGAVNTERTRSNSMSSPSIQRSAEAGGEADEGGGEERGEAECGFRRVSSETESVGGED